MILTSSITEKSNDETNSAEFTTQIMIDASVIDMVETYSFPVYYKEYVIAQDGSFSKGTPQTYRANAQEILSNFFRMYTGENIIFSAEDDITGAFYQYEGTTFSAGYDSISFRISGDIDDLNSILEHPYVKAMISFCGISDVTVLNYRNRGLTVGTDYDYILMQKSELSIETGIPYLGRGLVSMITISGYDDFILVSGTKKDNGFPELYLENSSILLPDEAVKAWYFDYADYEEMTFRVVDIVYEGGRNRATWNYILPYYCVQYWHGEVVVEEKIPMYDEEQFVYEEDSVG